VSILTLCANQIEGELSDILTTTGLSLMVLTYLYQNIRDSLPPTLHVSRMEWIVMLYLI